MQVSNKFGTLRKALSTRESIHAPPAAVDAMFPKTTNHHSRTMYVRGCVLCQVYVFIVVEEREASSFLVYELRFNLRAMLSFSYMHFAKEWPDSATYKYHRLELKHVNRLSGGCFGKLLAFKIWSLNPVVENIFGISPGEVLVWNNIQGIVKK